MQPLCIGLFTECYRPIQNGVVASVDTLAAALRARGHEVLYVTPQMPGYEERDRSIVRVPSLPLPMGTAYRLTVPLLWGKHEAEFRRMSIVHAHSPFITGWMGARVARKQRVPLVFTYHTQLEHYAHYIPFDARATRRAASGLTRAFANRADAVVVPTDAMQTRLRALGVRSQIAVVPSGIDLAQFGAGRRRDDVRARLGAGPDDKLVLYVGRLAREKNLELAFAAFARIGAPGARFALVGDGPHGAALKAQARQSGIADRVLFTRELPRAELPDAYASADVFLFPSGSETQGLVLVEALAAGLPVVAVDTPQTRDVLQGAGSVEGPDAAALAAALDRVLSGGPRDRTEARRAAARFDGNELGGRVLDLYASLLGAGS